MRCRRADKFADWACLQAPVINHGMATAPDGKWCDEIRRQGSGEGFVAGGAEDGVELYEDMVIVGMLIVAGKTHGGGEGFGGCREVATFTEREVGPAFLEAG